MRSCLSIHRSSLVSSCPSGSFTSHTCCRCLASCVHVTLVQLQRGAHGYVPLARSTNPFPPLALLLSPSFNPSNHWQTIRWVCLASALMLRAAYTSNPHSGCFSAESEHPHRREGGGNEDGRRHMDRREGCQGTITSHPTLAALPAQGRGLQSEKQGVFPGSTQGPSAADMCIIFSPTACSNRLWAEAATRPPIYVPFPSSFHSLLRLRATRPAAAAAARIKCHPFSNRK